MIDIPYKDIWDWNIYIPWWDFFTSTHSFMEHLMCIWKYNIQEYENLKIYWAALVNFCTFNLLFFSFYRKLYAISWLHICLIDETLHQPQKKSMHIYAKIVCALVNRFIKIISQGKSLLIRETLQWKYIYAKIVCAIHQNYLSLKNLLILQTLHQHSMEGLIKLWCILLLKKSGSKIKTTLCRRTLVKGHYFVNVELSKQKGCILVNFQ